MVSAPAVLRSLETFDTWPPRDARKGELLYLYWIEEPDRRGGQGDFWLHMVSLEQPRRLTIMFRAAARGKLERWFEVLA